MHKLIHFPLCAKSRSIRLLLSELGLEFELSEEKPWEWRAEFLALNPSGELPVLIRRYIFNIMSLLKPTAISLK